ncbi:hypothetical protein L3Y34_009279 [Caenorhabditis briggsae]|uniref:POU-specific atypical domain-containing protein n=1 Tax=Caenorhabditis briggsae TaxID=6238 RepID=A0AAE9A520_CAEBR|nr:hypothetical protein L3Y34_009279 [Caenorhabditis briggsae]
MELPNLYQNSLYSHLYFTGITPGQIAENLDSIRKQVDWQKSNQPCIDQRISSNRSLTWTSGQTYQQTGSIGNPWTSAGQNNISTGNPGLARPHPWTQSREQYAANMATLNPGQMTNGRSYQQYLQDCNTYLGLMQHGLMKPAQNSGNIAAGPMEQPMGQNQHYQHKTPSDSELEHERMMTPNQLLQQMANEQGTSNQTTNRYQPHNALVVNQNQNTQIARNTPSPRLKYAMFQLAVQKCQQANRSAGINLTGRASPIPYVTTDQLCLLMTQYPQLFPQRQGSPKMGQEQYSAYDSPLNNRKFESDDSGNVSMVSPTQQSSDQLSTWHAQLPRDPQSQVIYRTSPILRSMSNPTPPTAIKLPDDSNSNKYHILLEKPGPVRRCQTHQEALSTHLRSSAAPYNIRTNFLGSSVRSIKKGVPERPKINFLDPTNLEAEIASHQEMNPAQLVKVIAKFMTKNTISRLQVADMTETHHFYIQWFLEGNLEDVYPQCIIIFITWYLNCKKYPEKLRIYMNYPALVRPTLEMAYSKSQCRLLAAELFRDKKLTDAQIAENINKEVRITTKIIPMTAKLVKQWWKTKKKPK